MANNAFKSNRYHKPGQARYKSQFVPMPLDFMAKQIAGKQAKYDKQDLLMDTDSLWDQVSLPGHDTEWVKNKKKKLIDFQESLSGKDLGSSQVQKEYTKFMRDFKADEDSKSVKSAVALHNKYLERREELNKKGATSDAPVWYKDYEKKYKEYTKEGGLGFEGPGLGSHLITEGVDIREHAEKLYNNMGESGADYKKELENTGIYYEKGKVGISGKDVSDKTRAGLRSFAEGAGGRQLGAEYDAKVEDGYIDPSADYDAAVKNGYIDPDKISKEDYINKISKGEYIKDYLLDVGSERIHMKYTGTDAAALNTLRKENKEADEKITYQPIFSEYDEATSKTTKTKDLRDQMTSLDNQIQYQEQVVNSLPKGPEKTAAQSDLASLKTQQGLYKNAFEKQYNKLDAEYQNKVNKSNMSAIVEGTWMAKLFNSYDDPEQKLKNQGIIVNETTDKLGLEGDELLAFNLGMQVLFKDETLAAALQVFESGEGSSEAGTLFGLEVVEGGNLTYGNLQKLFNELEIDIDVTSNGLHGLGSTVIMKQESPQANSSKINYWRTKLIEGVAAQNGVNFEDITSIDGKVQYEKNNILNDFTTNFSQISTSQLDKDKWINDRINNREDGGVINYDHSVGVTVPKGKVITNENGSSKTFEAIDTAIEDDIKNNAKGWELYNRDGEDLWTALKEQYPDLDFDIEQITNATVDKGYYDKQGQKENGEKYSLGKGFTFNAEFPGTYTVDGEIKTEMIKADIFAVEPSGRSTNFFDQFEMYGDIVANDAGRINANSPTKKNWANYKDAQLSNSIIDQISTQVETSTEDYTVISTNNSALVKAGVSFKSQPIYENRGEINVPKGYNVAISYGLPYKDQVRFFPTKIGAYKHIENQTKLIEAKLRKQEKLTK